MKSLVIVVHPNIASSRINKAWMEELQRHDQITVHQLYETYPDEKIDVAKEQSLLLSHNRIIFQFPFYWYSSPPLLKKWLDAVLTYGWAYGPGGDNLKGKELGLAISTYSPSESYRHDGFNRFTMEELTRPFHATSYMIGTQFMPLYVLNGIARVSDEELAQNAVEYANYVTLRRVL